MGPSQALRRFQSRPSSGIPSRLVRTLLQATWGALLAAFIGLLAGKAATGPIIAVGIAFAAAFAYWLLTDQSATARFPALGRLPASVARPRLQLDKVVIHEAPVSTVRGNEPVGHPVLAAFIKVPVTNDHRATVPAEDVQAWLDFERTDGEGIANRVQARWAHTEQAPDRSRFARLDNPALNEARIPVGSTRHVDLLAFADEFGGFRMWTNESIRMLDNQKYWIDADALVVTLTVRASNTLVLTLKLRVGNGSDGLRVAALF